MVTDLGHCWPGSLGIRWHSLVYMQLWSPGFSLTSSRDLCCLLSWPLLLSETATSFWEPLFLAPKLLFFPNLNSQCVEPQCVSSLWIACSASVLIGGFRMWPFCLVQVLSKFTSSLHRLQPASTTLLLESSNSVSDIHPQTHIYAQLSTACYHLQLKLFFSLWQQLMYLHQKLCLVPLGKPSFTLS